MTSNSSLAPDTWHTVELRGLGQGVSGFSVAIDNQTIPYTSSQKDFVGVDFSSLNGLLYIGGHPSFAAIRVKNH